MVGKDQYGYITPAFSSSPWWGKINMRTSPLPHRGSPCWGKMNMATLVVKCQGPHSGERRTWLHQPLLLRVLVVMKDQYGCITPAFLGSP